MNVIRSIFQSSAFVLIDGRRNGVRGRTEEQTMQMANAGG
jgi:hypothetical protein